MLRSLQLAATAAVLLTCSLARLSAADGSTPGNDQSLWKEYGLVKSESSRNRQQVVTTYQFKDLTGALAAWEWQRSPRARSCDLTVFCSQETGRVIVSEANYLLVFEGPAPSKPQVEQALAALPNKRETSLPAILTFLPNEGRTANSARYVLGPASLRAFAPELASAKPGFEQGAEAQVAEYRLRNGSPVRLALFYYPLPEMARAHITDFKVAAGPHVKRSGVLVAVVFGPATDEQADTLLSRVQYEAKITWNETPPPSPVKPLYQLLVNIIYLSILLSALCLMAGLIYAGMRIYRRRYGTLDADEAMTTLHLTGD
jgi:hypothetical protein